MSTLAKALIAELDDEALDQLAQLLADRLADSNAGSHLRSPWLTVAEAAERMRSSKQRVYDLHSQERLEGCKDGSRLLFHVDTIDAYLEGSR